MEYTVHETLEVREIASFKTICLTKSKTMQTLVSDPELRSLMQRDVELSSRHLVELGSILSKAASGEMKI